jgi:hypothetical protein
MRTFAGMDSEEIAALLNLSRTPCIMPISAV